MKKTIVPKKKQSFKRRNNEIEALAYLIRNPNEELTVTDIAAKTGISKASASRAVKELKERGLVSVAAFGTAYRVRANTGNEAFTREKIASNFVSVMRSGIIDRLVEMFHSPKAIILFGSFRKGDDIPGSDVDIAVEMPEGGKTGISEPVEFRDFEKQVQRKVVVHAFSRKEVDINVFENIANGFVLYGFLEVSK